VTVDAASHRNPVGSPSGLDVARCAIDALGDDPLVWYFDNPLSGSEVDACSDALACGLAALGVGRGDRVALYLQNVPQFVFGLIATWKLGAVIVTANPMLRERELGGLLSDCTASVLICDDSSYEDVGRAAVEGSTVEAVITTSPLDFLGPRVPVALADTSRHSFASTVGFMDLITRHAGERPPAIDVKPDDLAVLIYTSGTTGPAKGAMIRHRNLVATSGGFAEVIGMDSKDSILALAPIFHVTGLVLHVMLSFTATAPLMLAHRFDPSTTLELITSRRPTFTVAAITAFNALLDHSGLAEADLSSLRAVYTGGAPVPPSAVDRWRKATGQYIHNAYGLTESAAPCIAVPLDLEAPVDPESGALSVGKALDGTAIFVCDDQRVPVGPGVTGEICVEGPGVVDGYWERPEESAAAIPHGKLYTGDVGFIDGGGWVYLVDRKKDMIIASGYKVWPREVEDVLCEHPAIREAAVVGAADAYRGETVHAFVSLMSGAAATPEDIIEFTGERLAAYKRPRKLVILDELPKTASGKILRRVLRDSVSEPDQAAPAAE
jgi:long-chain acyl-CoA synthetase